MFVLINPKATGGKATGSASFASRAQSAGDKNTNVGSGGAGGGGGNSSGDRIGKDSGGGGKGSTGVSK